MKERTFGHPSQLDFEPRRLMTRIRDTTVTGSNMDQSRCHVSDAVEVESTSESTNKAPAEHTFTRHFQPSSDNLESAIELLHSYVIT